MIIQQAKREFEECAAENIQSTKNKYIRNWQLARERMEPLDHKGMRGLLKKDREMAKNLDNSLWKNCIICTGAAGFRSSV